VDPSGEDFISRDEQLPWEQDRNSDTDSDGENDHNSTSDDESLIKIDAEAMLGAGITLRIKPFINIFKLKIDLGTQHSPIFGDDYVTQGFELEVLFGFAEYKRSAIGQTKGFDRNPFTGEIIPGSGKSVSDVLKGKKFKPDGGINWGWMSTDLKKFSIGAQYLVGLEASIDISKGFELVNVPGYNVGYRLKR
jgi:hypothetical protein